jgi:hypothetical protein
MKVTLSMKYVLLGTDTDTDLVASLRRIFNCHAVSVNLDADLATPSVSFLAGRKNPSPLWMQ